MAKIEEGVCNGCRIMLRKAREFAKDDSGAVTVDHVVLTAATMGLGLAVIGTISGGLNTASSTVSTQVGRNIISTAFYEAVTNGLIATAQYGAGDLIDDLGSVNSFAFKLEATLNAEDEGVLFEIGGTGHGTILYQHDGKLYLQGGRGNGTGPSPERGEAVWDISEGAYTIEGSLDRDSGLALYINGQVVDTAAFTASRVSGGNVGAVGDAAASTPVNRAGFRQGDRHAGAGTLTIFKDQTIPDAGST